MAQSSSQAEQFRILMIRSVEISFSLSAEGHYQHGQLLCTMHVTMYHLQD